MRNQPILGLIMGAVLGLALWLVAALAIFYTLGYLSRMLPYIWYLLGILMIIAAVLVTLTALPRRPAIALDLPQRS